MNWIFCVAIGVVLIFLYFNYQIKRKQKRLRETLKKQWGKPQQKGYYNFSFIGRYFESHTDEESFFVISEQTANDLDFEKLFESLDHTTSSIGQQYLYKRLRMLKGKESVKSLQFLTSLFLKNEKLSIDFQELLSKLSSTNAYDLELLTRERINSSKKYQGLLFFLSLTSITLIIAGIFRPSFFIGLLPVVLINGIFHYMNKSNIQYYLSSITQLSIAYNVTVRLYKSNELVKYYDFSFLKKIREVINKVSIIGAEKRLDTEMAQLVWFVTEWIKILFNFEILIFYRLEKDLATRRDQINQLFELIGEIDVAIAIASLRSMNKTICEPIFINEKNIVATELYHPLLENGVANDFNLSNKSLLLTGANMSGKTTFIKTLAVNALLSETLGICYASSFQLPYMRIFASIKISDDLLANTSYYLQEVLNVKLFVEASKEGVFSLFILDELFKGTNTVERIAAGRAVLSYLNNDKSIVLVSTHDIELAELLEKASYQLHCFDEKVADDEIYFSYKLKDGIPREKNAIKILELYNYPKSITHQAKDVARGIEEKHLN